jgi:hypothetical protein
MLADYTAKPIEFEGQFYDQRHGGPFDRGAADSYYNRGHEPHYYEAGTGTSRRFDMHDMTALQITAYTAGYNWNEQQGNKKDWG